jgi:hypothetical protein
MTDEIPERDPLADLVSRSIGVRVPSVEAEILPSEDGVERKRLRFATAAGSSTAIFERLSRGETTEAQLLPFLARKTDRVPALHSRGIPPPHVSLGPWVLIEDVYAGALACDGDVVEILESKRAIEQAVAKDLPALRALGLRDDTRALPPSLAGAARTLVHGHLVCANARRVARGVVLVGWRRAFVGAGVLDAASLALDLERAHRPKDAAAVREAHAAEGDAALLVEAERFLSSSAAP